MNILTKVSYQTYLILFIFLLCNRCTKVSKYLSSHLSSTSTTFSHCRRLNFFFQILSKSATVELDRSKTVQVNADSFDFRQIPLSFGTKIIHCHEGIENALNRGVNGYITGRMEALSYLYSLKINSCW